MTQKITIIDLKMIPVNQLKGVGPAMEQKLSQLGIFSVYDLLFYFPFRFEDLQLRELHTLLDQEKAALKGTVVSTPTVAYYQGRKNRLQFQLQTDQAEVSVPVIFFNQAYLKKSLELGQEIAVYGKWQTDRGSLLGMKLLHVSDEADSFAPVYRLTKGLSQKVLVGLIRTALAEYQEALTDLIPERINDYYQWLPLDQAVRSLHFPEDPAEYQRARQKLTYYEFFIYEWRIQSARMKLQSHAGIRVLYDNDELRTVIQALPYDLTSAQKRAVNEICYDLRADYPMQRLLQGDVGSGKTLVSFLAMIATVNAGMQTAMMVPTEILAQQHYQSFNQLFESMGLHAECLVSAMPKEDKESVLQGLATGRIRVVIGTHALIQETVQFRQLGLVVIDEQHRFGVNQRQCLVDKGRIDLNGSEGVHTTNQLQMTATPIPRSLALSIYGELTVSTIDELPRGRQPVTTRLVNDHQVDQVYQHMEVELAAGHQVYYVLPLIESSEHISNVEDVLSVRDRLQAQWPDYAIEVLHGQLDKYQQEEVMRKFKDQQIQILVATTMIEVGVDVANATMMIIQSAERFGLAQLHQLRGRVGRSDLASFCYLIANPTTEQGQHRMQVMVDSQDGFYISHEDMKLRGIGDVLGQVQSGLPQFKLANFVTDQSVLQQAQADVKVLLDQPYLMTEEEQQLLVEWNRQVSIDI